MHKLDAYPLWTAMVTPMNDGGDIHYEDFTGLLKRQEAAGNGILVLGSTGEGLSLDEEEKKEVVKFVSSLDLKVPLMVGIGGFDLKKTLEWLDFCEQYPIDSYLMVTPIYSKPGPKGQKMWFEKLLDTASKPCMLYNIPSRSGVPLSIKTAEELQEHPNFWSIKESSGTIADFENYREKLPSISVFSGEDGLIPYLGVAGVKGLVSVLSNVWPEVTNEFVRRCLKGKSLETLPLWRKACQALFRVTNPIPAKMALYQKRWLSSPTLRLPLTHTELLDGKELEDIDKKLSIWAQENHL